MNKINMLFIGLGALVTVAILAPFCFAQDLRVYGEAAWQDDSIGQKVVVAIYGDTLAGAAPLISFGIRLTYPSDLTLDTSSSSGGYITGSNKEVWYFGTPSDKYDYTDVYEESATEVIVIGGILDTGNPTGGQMLQRTLLATLVFNLEAGATMPPTFGLTYGRPGDYKDFVANDGKVLDDEVDAISFSHPDYPSDAVRVAEAGDANGDGSIGSVDFQVTQQVFLNNMPFSVWADCNGDADVGSVDFQCAQFRFIN